MRSNAERERLLRFTMEGQGHHLVSLPGNKYRITLDDDVPTDGIYEAAVIYDDGRLEDVERWWLDGTGYETADEMYGEVENNVAVVDALVMEGLLDVDRNLSPSAIDQLRRMGER